MKKIVSLMAVLAVVSTPAFAAPKKKTTVKKTTETTTTTTTQTTTTPVADTPALPPSPRQTYASKTYGTGWSADAGFGSVAEKFHLGIGVKYEMPLTLESTTLKVGGRTGFYFGPSDPSTWFVPIAATATYELKTEGGFKPYFGVDIGFAIFHSSGADVIVPGLGTQTIGGDTNIRFLGMVRPGAHLGQRYYIEVPVGVIGSNFAIIPSVGMHF